ncbi:MAG: T9SS type A sorting domain-containing protein [Bacteroidia bacterium]
MMIQSTSAQTCTWIGNTTAWDDPNNWSPGIPAINKDAVIPVVNAPFVYPAINEFTNAQCHSLKLKDNGAGTGSLLNIDAINSSSLTIADSLIIGDGATGGSSAAIKISSINNPTVTIPGATSVPPAGLALTPQTPFRAIAQCKTQVTYTAQELAVTYGLKSGTVIDKLSFVVNSISPAPAGPATFQNFRIQAFLTSSPTTYPFPPPSSIKVAVMFGDASVLAGWPKTIFSTSSLVLNMPNATGGTQANGNYQTLVLNPNTLIWDGVSNLVLSFEYNTDTGSAPLKNYVLYDEAGASFKTLSLSYNVVGTIITGYNIDGLNHWSGGVQYGIAANTSNQRPRIDFTIAKIYQPFPISIGGNWINNNAGGNGFSAGNSMVTFNGNADSKIMGQSTTFDKITINKLSNANKITLYNNITVDSVLNLNKGKLFLNQNLLNVNNPDANAITKVNGAIVSESQNAPYSYINWNVADNYDQHVFPFANSTGTYIPFIYKQITGNAGYVKAATYKTNLNNLPYPTGVTNVNDTNGVNNKAYTVDRFWAVSRTGTTGNAHLKFSYKNTEAPVPITSGNLEANRYDFSTNLWQRFTNFQTNITGAMVSSLKINNVSATNLVNGMWALSDMTSPLRIDNSTENFTEIYPNPFNDYIHVALDPKQETAVDYIIYDATMRAVAEGKLNVGDEIINTQNLSRGAYILKINSGELNLQQKILKM